MGDDIDGAFDWLVLIISTVNGVLIGLPEGFEAKKAMAGVLLPFFVLVMVWLLSHLVKREHLKVVLKTYAWFYALFMILLFGEIFVDQIYGLIRVLNVSLFVPYPPLAILFVAFMISVPFVFFDLLVRPAYKEIYRDSRLLSSRKQLILLYAFAIATFVILFLPSVLSRVFG